MTLPVAVDGYVDNLARDYYKFKAAAGQSYSVLVRSELGTGTWLKLMDVPAATAANDIDVEVANSLAERSRRRRRRILPSRQPFGRAPLRCAMRFTARRKRLAQRRRK